MRNERQDLHGRTYEVLDQNDVTNSAYEAGVKFAIYLDGADLALDEAGARALLADILEALGKPTFQLDALRVLAKSWEDEVTELERGAVRFPWMQVKASDIRERIKALLAVIGRA